MLSGQEIVMLQKKIGSPFGYTKYVQEYDH